MEYNELKEGQEIEFFWHFYSSNLFWKKGIVSVMEDGKYFFPRGMIMKIKILPSDMGKVRKFQNP